MIGFSKKKIILFCFLLGLFLSVGLTANALSSCLDYKNSSWCGDSYCDPGTYCTGNYIMCSDGYGCVCDVECISGDCSGGVCVSAPSAPSCWTCSDSLYDSWCGDNYCDSGCGETVNPSSDCYCGGDCVPSCWTCSKSYYYSWCGDGYCDDGCGEDTSSGSCYCSNDCRQCGDSCSDDNDCVNACPYCSGGVCKSSICKDNGESCTAASQCCSGYCKDGYCCNQACTGTCQTCNLSATYRGTCYCYYSGDDPESECYGTGTCGGTCNGSCGCQYPSTSVSCGTKDCDYLDTTCRNYHDVTRYCNGAGSCGDPACNSYTNASAGTKCGTCQTCNGSGSCSSTPADDSACGTIDCDGLDSYYQTGTESPTATEYCYYKNYSDLTSNRCEGFGDCKDANTTSDCTSYSDSLQYSCGTCKYISSSNCTGGTQGSCTNYSKGTSCGTNKECDGSGNCVNCAPPTGTISASKTTVNTGEQFTITVTGNDDYDVWYLYVKEGAGGTWDSQACLFTQTSCTKTWNFTKTTPGTYQYYGWVIDSDDVNGCANYHESATTPTYVTVTVVQPCKTNGQTCSAGSECCSTYCKDGVCCNSSCTGTCVSCNLAGGVGTCSYVPNNQDPDNECYGTGTCGGTCNGSGACQYPATGTKCGICQTCNGSGSCNQTPADDSDCGAIDCDGLDSYYQTGTESPTATEYCYYKNYSDLTSNRCEGFGNCKDANTADCTIYSDTLQYSCGTCKYISATNCTGGTQGSCTNYSKGTSCSTNKECDGDGNCVTCYFPTGTISVSKTTVEMGETFTISITGYDDNDVWYITYNKDSNIWNDTNQQKCTFTQTECTKSWNITENTAGTYTYYGRVRDSDDVHGCSSWHEAGAGSVTVTVTQVDPPTARTDPATNITGTSARLNGCVTATGGADYRVRFVWGDTSSYGSASSWTGYYSYTTCFYFDATGLTKGKTYHFRIEAQNSADYGYGVDTTFITKPDPPSGFTATTVSASQINLSWTKGSGAYYTMIRRSTTGYPTSPTIGTQVYYDTGTSYSDTGLTADTTYYYSAWSRAYEEGYYQYSDTYVTVSETATTPQRDCDLACKNLGYPGGYCAARDWAREQCVLGGYSSEVVDIGFQGKCVVPPLLIGSCQCCQPIVNTKIDCYFGATTCIFDKSTVTLGNSVWVCGILRTAGGTAISGKTISFYVRTDGSYDKVFDVGTTDSNGYACKSWTPPDDSKYAGTKKYILYFAGDGPYNQSQTAEYSLTVKCNAVCQAAGAVGGYITPFHCTTCDGVCGWISYRAAAIPMGYATVCLLGQDCYFPLSSFTVNNRGESCSGPNTICQAGKCPSIYSQAYNGDSCVVRRSNCTGYWTGEFGLISFGVWDAYESKCIECDYTARKETAVCGDTTKNYQECDCGLSLSCDYYNLREDFPCNGPGDGQCESACGASTECDEKNPGDSCGAGKTCNSTCQCITTQCYIGGVYYNDGQCNPTNKCQYCDKSNPSSWSNVPSGKVCAAAGVAPVSATNYCYYDEDCDNGDCYATKWYTSCNGTGSCRAAADHTDSYSTTFNASNGYVLKSDCSEASPSTTLYCGTATDCTAGTCTGHKYYRACNGTGGCRIDNLYAYDETIYAPAGKVLTSTCGNQDATAAIKCAATVNKCTDGSCSGEKRYPECQSGGVCDSSATTYYTSETVYASTGYTLTSTCGTTGTTLCGYSSWNGCNGTCQKKRDQLRCDAAHNCAYDVGDDFAYLSTAGKVCSGGSEVAPSSSVNCDKTINCVDNACSAERFYRGCVAGGTSCTETGKVSYTAWNAPSNYTISETIYKIGDTCNTNQDICGYSGYNKCGGVGSPYSCQKGRDPYRCNGAGSCTYDAGDDWANVAADKVCLNGSEVALSCTYYCGPAGNYCTEDRQKGEFRQACGGTGSCNGITLGCSNIQDCGATSNTCSSKCQKDYTYTCSAGSCGTYHTYTTAFQGYRCEGGNLINTGSCALSAYNGRSADKCDKKRDLYRCNGLGSTDANCIFDVGDEWAYVAAYKIVNASGQEVDASSADNTGTCHICTEGNCSGTYRWAECDGSGNPGPCITYSQPETIYPAAGYSLTSTCGTTGTTLCDATLRASPGPGDNNYGAGGTYNCQGMCDGNPADPTPCDYAVNCIPIDTTPPTTGIKIIRTATGEDVTTAGTWLRADNYTIKFEDKDQADGSGLNCENCTCEYSVYACDAGGVNCTTAVTPLTSRSPNWSFQITAGKTDPNYWREGVGRYRIYSGAKDMANNPSATEYRYINFDFTPPWTEIR